MNLNEVIREKRTEKQLTQEQLANVLEVSKQTVSNWETGETTPDVETLKKLAVVLEFSIDEALNLEIETKDDLVDWLIIAGMFLGNSAGFILNDFTIGYVSTLAGFGIYIIAKAFKNYKL